MTFNIWRGLVAACSSALARGYGGDFDASTFEQIQSSMFWLQGIGVQKGYYDKLDALASQTTEGDES